MMSAFMSAPPICLLGASDGRACGRDSGLHFGNDISDYENDIAPGFSFTKQHEIYLD